MYTYQKAKSGILPDIYEDVYLFGAKYEISGNSSECFLGNTSGDNDWVFRNIIKEDKNEFFEKILGPDGYRSVNTKSTSSPYAKTLEGMRRVLLAIWEYEFFKPGDKVVVIMNKLQDSDNSYVDGIFIADNMKLLENKQFTIKKAIVFEGGEYTESYHMIYKLKEDETSCNWPYHTLKKISQSQECYSKNTEGINNRPNNRISTVKLPTIKKLKIVL